jgi:hypothetical protein
MPKYSKAHINILKETCKIFLKHDRFIELADRFFVNKDNIYFQTPFFQVVLKFPGVLDGDIIIDQNKVFMADAKNLNYVAQNSCGSLEIDRDPLTLYIYAEVAASSPRYTSHHRLDVLRTRLHGNRLYSIMECDIPHIKTAIDFVEKHGYHDCDFTNNYSRNILLDRYAYATDNYFAIKSNALRTNTIGQIQIPKTIAQIIKHSDKDIIVRTTDSYVELENEYFDIFYNKPTQAMDTSVFDVNYEDHITVNKRDFLMSLRGIKKYFQTVTAKTQTNRVDLKMSVNGRIEMIPVRDENYTSAISGYTRSFNGDLQIKTFGNRLMKILSSIKDDEIKIKIPRGSGGLLINNNYLLMSWTDWI